MTLEIGDVLFRLSDLLCLLGVLSPESLILAPQPLDLVRVGRRSPLLRPPSRHSSDGTPIASSCTAPLNCYRFFVGGWTCGWAFSA